MDAEFTARLDRHLIALCSDHWQKTAMVIALARERCESEKIAIDFQTLGERLAILIANHHIESRGQIDDWRHSEIRIAMNAHD